MKQRIEMIFSLMFFFFAIILMLALIFSVFVENFYNLLPIMLKEGGFFATFSEVLLVFGFCASLYMYIKHYKRGYSKIHRFVLFGMVLFICFFSLCVFSAKHDNELDNILEIYSYTESYTLFNSVRIFVIEIFVFVFFIMLPIVSFFYKKRMYDNYFYQTYIKEITPSINISIIFLFGYIIRYYNANYVYSMIDVAVAICGIAFVIRIIFRLRQNITFYVMMNLLVLLCGFVVIYFNNELFVNGNSYYASLLFYSIGLLYWQFNTLLKLQAQ